MTPPRVACLGVTVLDVLGRPCTDLPPGQVGQRIEEIRLTAAGTAAGTAVDIVKLGMAARLIACVGDDEAGDFLLALLRRNGVDATAVQRTTRAQTSSSMLPIRPNGERPAYHVVGANAHVSTAHLDLSALLGDCDHLHVGGPESMGSFLRDDLNTVLEAGRAAGVTASLDLLSARVRHAAAPVRSALPLVDYFLPNEEQICDLYQRDDVEEAAAQALADGAGAVIVSLGADGCLLAHGETRLRMPAYEVDVVDTTGCGDAFTAGFLAGACGGADLRGCAQLACAAGSLAATGLGSDAGIVDMSSVRAMMRAHPGPSTTRS